MKKILVVSPHFDDAVLSVGQFLADRPDAEVVTVYGGYPENSENVQTPYDQKCGFENAQDAVSVRRRENDEALALLEANVINFSFPDSQYENRSVNHVTKYEIQEALQNMVNENDYEFILAPLGLGHPDHIKVADAAIRLQTSTPIYLWEDLPLRVVEPQLVPPRLLNLGLTIDDLWQTGTTGDKMAKKIRAMLCYRSQINTGILDPYLMYVPERLWKYQ